MIKCYILFFLSCCNVAFAQDFSISKDSVDAILRESFKDSNNGKNDIALEKQDFVVAWAKYHKNDSFLANTYNVIAANYIALEDFTAAETYLNRALEFAEKSDNQSTMVIIYNNFGHLNARKENWKAATDYFEMSLKQSEKVNAKNSSKLWTVINLAAIYFENKEYEKSRHFFNETIRFFEPNSQHQPEILVDAYKYLSELDVIDKKYDSALEYIKIADSLGQEIKNYRQLEAIEEVYYDIYSKTNQPKKATASLEKKIEYLKEQLATKDEEYKKTAALKQRVLDQQKALEIKDQTYEVQQKSLRLTRLFTIFLLLLCAGILIVLYLLNRSNRRNKKLNEVLLRKNKQLQDSKEKTEQAVLLKENFFATINHELRTPLYAVTGITDMLLEEKPKSSQVKHLKILKSSGEYLLALINNTLQINKFDKKGLTLQERPFNLRDIVENVKLSLNYLKKENNNTITVEIDDNIPKVLIGDGLKIAQVLNNLVNNSLKFTSNGKIVIRVEVVDKKSDQIDLKISVIDDGIGISKDKHEQIFSDFYQESMKLDRNHEGIGLGLAIVKRLLNIMGSTIHLHSKENEGSTFYFNLQLKYEEVKKGQAATTIDAVSLENFAVLVVDDNKVNQLINKRLLDKKNASVTLVYNGPDAIEKAKNNHYDIILMDIHMPGMDGYETTSNIRIFDKTTPIIALTAIDIETNKDKIYESGMNDALGKPFRIEDFFNVLNKFLTLEKK